MTMTARFPAIGGLACAVLLVACGGSTEPGGGASITVSMLLSPEPRVGAAFSVNADTLVIDVRTSTGLPVHGVIATDGTTGWLKQVGRTLWERAPLLGVDSSGRVRVLWQASGSPKQELHLAAGSFTAPRVQRVAYLTQAALPLTVDTVVTSGVGAVCVQQGGRVGCTGDGKCASCNGAASSTHEAGRLHWFGFSAPIASITSTISGACALLTDGNTACWDGLGPDSVATNDSGHPPFVELRGSVGRTATGAVWVAAVAAPYSDLPLPFAERKWLRMPSDSAIVSLLEHYTDLFVCGVTASSALMCASTLDPARSTVRSRPLALVRNQDSNTAVRALGGYAKESYAGGSSTTTLVVLRPSGTSVAYSRSFSDTTAWIGIPTVDSSLSGPDARVRDCVVVLGGCGSAAWRSVSQSGRTYNEHISYEGGFRKTCGIRGVIVCHTYLARGYQTSSLVTVDTIRLAP